MESLLFLPSTKRKSFLAKLASILSVVILARIWVLLVHKFFDAITTWIPFDAPMQPDVIPPFYYSFIYGCVLTPIWEELAWRWFPITVAKRLGQQFVFPACVISSISFGLAHGDGMESVFMQGVGGMMFCILYIKNKYSYLSTVLAHALFNFTLLINFPH
jgi:membrane protease YdiL (CAAX protease family)